MAPPKTMKPKSPNLNMGVSVPTGYIDEAKIGAATPPGAPTALVKSAAPKLGGAVTQRKLGTQLTAPGSAGAVLPANEAKMQGMMDTSTAKIGQGTQTGAKTPEAIAADNKNYKGLLKKFQLY